MKKLYAGVIFAFIASASLNGMFGGWDPLKSVVQSIETTARNNPIVNNFAQTLLLNKRYQVAKNKKDTKEMANVTLAFKGLLSAQVRLDEDETLMDKKPESFRKSEREKLVAILQGMPDEILGDDELYNFFNNISGLEVKLVDMLKSSANFNKESREGYKKMENEKLDLELKNNSINDDDNDSDDEIF